MKKRLDVLLAERGLFDSREKARRAVMAGVVLVDGQKCDKAGTGVKTDVDIKIIGNTIPFVSRGGLKLDKAIKKFDLNLDSFVCMDIGASTGGFTDCMLQNNAKKVYSVDVGYGQLAWKLRNDERVVCLERTNIRHLDNNLVEEPLDFASIDVSFISLRKVLPKAKELLKKGGNIVALIKPQFEAGREKVGKNGVVRELSTHIEVIDLISKHVISKGYSILDLDFSPIKGPKGNREYLIYLSTDDETESKFNEYGPRGLEFLNEVEYFEDDMVFQKINYEIYSEYIKEIVKNSHEL